MHLYLYQPLLLWLVFAVIFEYFKPDSKLNKWFFGISVAVMTFMQIFRYGQNDDYWGYRRLYIESPRNPQYIPHYFLSNLSHSEIGFKLFNCIFRALGITSFWFYAIFGTLTITFIVVFIVKNVSRINLAALIFYPTLFLTYVMSGVRQGFSTALFLCFGIDMLKQKKYVHYFFLVLLCGCFHKYTLILLILIPIHFMKEKWLVWCVPISWALGLFYAFCTPLHTYLTSVIDPSSQLYRLTTANISWLGLAERTVCFSIISFLFWIGNRTESDSFLYKIYACGYLISVIMLTTDFGSQRLMMPIKMVEIVLIPLLISECPQVKYRFLATGAMIAIMSLMAMKNIHFYRDADADYNCLNRPFISIIGRNDVFNDDCLSEFEEFVNNYYTNAPAGKEYYRYYFNSKFNQH